MPAERVFSGFVYKNTGTIADCYSAIKLASSRAENAGFVYTNAGKISRCFSRSIGKAYKQPGADAQSARDGFYSVNRGGVTDSFFLCRNAKELEQYRDHKLGLLIDDAQPDRLQEAYHWDFSAFTQENAARMELAGEKHELTESPVVMIDSEKEFLEAVYGINRGEADSGAARYALSRDLDFKGKKIPVIAPEQDCPFSGVFDGQGHTIKGFVLKAGNLPQAGFFGYIKDGVVCNLNLDGIVDGQNSPVVAAFCANNQGEIHCCEAVCDISAGSKVGGFAAYNGGIISKCSISGKFYSPPLFLPFMLLPLIPVALLTAFILLNPPQQPKDYLPVMQEMSIIPNIDDDQTGGRTNENMASFQAPKELHVDAGTLIAENKPYVILNPDRGANYDFVAKIYMTNTSGGKVLVYQSGRIPVGYHIEELQLAPPQGVTLEKGQYDATLQFTFYHVETGEKGMIDSEVPITLVLK